MIRVGDIISFFIRAIVIIRVLRRVTTRFVFKKCVSIGIFNMVILTIRAL